MCTNTECTHHDILGRPSNMIRPVQDLEFSRIDKARFKTSAQNRSLPRRRRCVIFKCPDGDGNPFLNLPSNLVVWKNPPLVLAQTNRNMYKRWQQCNQQAPTNHPFIHSERPLMWPLILGKQKAERYHPLRLYASHGTRFQRIRNGRNGLQRVAAVSHRSENAPCSPCGESCPSRRLQGRMLSASSSWCHEP